MEKKSKVEIVAVLTLAAFLTLMYMMPVVTSISSNSEQQIEPVFGEHNKQMISQEREITKQIYNQEDRLNREPAPEPKATKEYFNDGFETYPVGNPPPDTWLTSLQTGVSTDSGVEDFEDDTLGEAPDSPPWSSQMDSEQDLFFDDFEDDTLGGNPDNPPWNYRTENGDADVSIISTPAGGPTGSQSLEFDEGIDEGSSYSYFGSDSVGSGSDAVFEFYIHTRPSFSGTRASSQITLYGDSMATQTILFWGDEYSDAVGFVFFYGDGSTYEIWGWDEWHRVTIDYDCSADTYDLSIDGSSVATGLAFYEGADVSTIDGLIVFGGESMSSSVLQTFDDIYHYIPPTGGGEIIEIDTPSPVPGDNRSVHLDQSNSANVAYTKGSIFGTQPYGWGTGTASFALRTSQPASTSDGACVDIMDSRDNTAMTIRVNSGELQASDGGSTWTTLTSLSDNTWYNISCDFDTTSGSYSVDVDGSTQATGLGFSYANRWISNFKLYGTASTRSEVWFDNCQITGGALDAEGYVDDTESHTGSNSFFLDERGGQSPSYTAGDAGLSKINGTFEFWFNIAPEGDGMEVYLLDEAFSNYPTIIDIGCSPNGGLTSGSVYALYEDAGSLWYTSFGSYNYNEWHQIGFEYDIDGGPMGNGTFDLWYDGTEVSTGLGFMDPCDSFTGGVFQGTAPNQGGYASTQLSAKFWIDDVTHRFETLTHDIPLSSSTAGGWNLVSYNIAEIDTSLTSILEDPDYGISGSYDKLMYYDSANDIWRTYVPSRSDHYNGLRTWDRSMGVWIHMTADDTLTVDGYSETTTSITLRPGWNMVGYPSSTAGNNGLPAEVDKIGYFDGAAQYNLAYETADPQTFTFNPGEGYWIHNPTNSNIYWDVTY